MCEETEIIGVRRTPLAIAALKNKMSSYRLLYESKSRILISEMK